MGNNRRNREPEPKGFDGLSSMVSDVEDAISRSDEKTPKKKPGRSEDPDSTPRTPSSFSEQQDNAPATAPHSSPGIPVGKILLGIAGSFFLIWLLAEASSTNSSASRLPEPQTSTKENPFDDLDTPSESGESPASAGLSTDRVLAALIGTEKPPVGRDHILTEAQIRYCLAESIRIDGADPEVDVRISREVSAFNQRVEDYNNRCSEFRYREGALRRARADVEPFREALLAQGRDQFLREVGRAQSEQVTPDPTVREAQRLLNELGYAAGPVDGFVGPKTRAAVLAFQEETGGPIDGVIDGELLRQLRSAAQSDSNT